MALGLTQPLTEISTRNIPWGVQTARAYDWPHHLHVLTVLKSGSLNLPETSGPVETCTGTAVPCLTVRITQGITKLLHNGLKQTIQANLLHYSTPIQQKTENPTLMQTCKWSSCSHVSCLAMAHKVHTSRSSFPATATELTKRPKSPSILGSRTTNFQLHSHSSWNFSHIGTLLIHNQGWHETCGHPGQAKNLVPLEANCL
jgi:hypothetical protein